MVRAGNLMTIRSIVTPTRAPTTATAPTTAPTVPSTPPPATDDIELREKAKGAAVTELHTLLRTVGAPGVGSLSKDGDVFSKQTQSWVKQFQLAVGLSPADGVVEASTWGALRELAAAGTVVFQTKSPEGRLTYGGQLASFSPTARPDGYRPLDQNSNPKDPLGDQSSTASNLRDQGCVVTSFAMIASKLLGTPVTPTSLNEPKNFRAGSADFSSSKATKQLGLTSEPLALHDVGFESTLLAAIDRGAGVMVRVDFTGTDKGDHTVIVTGRTGTTLRGVDPATGGPLELKLEADGALRGGGWRRYQATGVTIIDKPGSLAVDDLYLDLPEHP